MTAELWAVSLAGGFFPQWDPAKYGVAGVRLAAAVRHLDPLAFLAGVNRLGLWPPLYPLAETPAFLLFGDGYRVAAGFVGALYFLTALAAFWAGRWVAADGTDELRPSIAGALTALAVLVCPIGHLFGTLSMLEVPGALLVFVAVGATRARWPPAAGSTGGGPASPPPRSSSSSTTTACSGWRRWRCTRRGAPPVTKRERSGGVGVGPARGCARSTSVAHGPGS